MTSKKIVHHPLLFNTLLLSTSGVLVKIIGFLYRIFLSRTMGAEELGIYQLIFPVFSVCFALSASGLSTGISKYVAQLHDNGKGQLQYFYSGIAISLFLSMLCFLFLQMYAPWIARYILLEQRCSELVRFLSYSVPLSAVHACINSYYYGRQKAVVPAVSQLIEQISRVASVWLFYSIASASGRGMTAASAAIGLSVGEGAACLFCLTAFSLRNTVSLKAQHFYSPFISSVLHNSFFSAGKTIFFYALPLTTNRLSLTLFSSLETILIPGALRNFGYSSSEALRTYGVLTGMALSVIYFPTVFSNSVSVMILPYISEASSLGEVKKIKRSIHLTITGSVFLGFFCTGIFLLFGNFIGIQLFHNALAADFIKVLSWICPFLFLGSVLSSVLHGLGHPMLPFLLNLGGCGIRIFFIYYLIPVMGLEAYLIGILVSQVVCAIGSILCVYKVTSS